MTEWDLMTEIAKASNKGDQQKLSDIIINNDLNSNPRASMMAISGIEVTLKNISKYIDASKKLISLPAPQSFREALRQDVIKQIIDDNNL